MSKKQPLANLLTFTIDLNRDANLEMEVEHINLAELESTLARLGSPMLGPRIAKVVRDYTRLLENHTVET